MKRDEACCKSDPRSLRKRSHTLPDHWDLKFNKFLCDLCTKNVENQNFLGKKILSRTLKSCIWGFFEALISIFLVPEPEIRFFALGGEAKNRDCKGGYPLPLRNASIYTRTERDALRRARFAQGTIGATIRRAIRSAFPATVAGDAWVDWG